MGPSKISQALLNRLPGYLDYLKNLPGQDHYISATTIANALGLGDVQVRKDLAAISDAGRRRTGRSRDHLIRDIEAYLGFSCAAPTIVVGSSGMGRAFLDYSGFDHSGLKILACFDRISHTDHSSRGRPIYPMDQMADYCRSHRIRIAILAVPVEDAQPVCEELVRCGVQAIWNLSPTHVRVPDGIALRNESFAASASALLAQMNNTN